MIHCTTIEKRLCDELALCLVQWKIREKKNKSELKRSIFYWLEPCQGRKNEESRWAHTKNTFGPTMRKKMGNWEMVM
jgi:hypothetical protein